MKKRSFILLMTLVLTLSTTACGAKKDLTAPTAKESNSYPEYVCTDEAESPAEYYSDASAKYESAADHATRYPESFYYEGEENFSGETYEILKEGGFKDVSRSPLSTFAADVDTASYSNMRRFVNAGYGLYDFDNVAIRAEEMINYFKYDYAAPKKGERFAVDPVLSDCPWNKDNKLLILGINTKTLTEGKRPDSNIVFLIDISGSMRSENKLPLLKDSMKLLLENLTKNDRVSIVTYASGTEVVLDGVCGDQGRKINKAFDDLKAGGGTNGEGGIELAYEIAEKNFIEDGNNRVILATDGDFNIGKCRGNELEDLISEKKETGVFLSVLGFGMGNYNDVTAETLADSGNGNYSYIDSFAEAKKVLVDEFGSTLYTVAKDTKFQVEFNPAMVAGYRLVGYENRALADEDFTDDTKDGGEIGAGHQVTVIYEIVPADKEKASGLKYQDTSLSKKGEAKDEWCTLSIAYKDPDKNESDYLEFPIGADNYTTKPSDNFILATSVAEYAMALNNSESLVDMTREEALDQAIKNVKKLDSDDDIIIEFIELMEKVAAGESDGYWYE
ncbi:MAG: von Willebrand factor type A domain-containing protein [Lachnospiraceae bacterium]|nr:von Willebrand factor type A domain-containing protein [Lachnospiraceae bacterium]